MPWFQVLFDAVNEGVGFLDLDGTLLALNHSLSDLINCPRQAALNHLFGELPLWAHFPTAQLQLRAAVIQASSGQIMRQTLECSDALDQRIHVFDLSITPLSDGIGAVLQLAPHSKQTDALNRGDRT